jgi:hypothetical protein
MSKIKGGAEAARQNFSMHPELLKVFIDTANNLNSERADLIINDRSKRVTYSKVAAAIIYHVKETLLGPNNGLTDQMRHLIAAYEASPYDSVEQPLTQEIHKRSRRSNQPYNALPQGRPLIISMEELENDDEL